jgi:hypothetical protein
MSEHQVSGSVKGDGSDYKLSRAVGTVFRHAALSGWGRSISKPDVETWIEEDNEPAISSPKLLAAFST